MICVMLLMTCGLDAQGPFETRPYAPSIKALQVHRAGWSLSYPVIHLGQPEEGIAISFDYLNASPNEVSYTIRHCDAQWRPSDLSVNEYLEGFESNYLDDYDYAQGTNVEYVHYRLQLPNASAALLRSGNYAVIFKDEGSGDTLACACFYMVDERVSIAGQVGGIAMAGESDEMQQLNLSIDHSDYAIEQAISESQVVVKQNNSRLRQAYVRTPTYIYDGRLVYDNQPKLAFAGGDEYRYFDCSSLRFEGHGIEQITYHAPFYHIALRTNVCQHHLPYRYDDDINGKFVIRRQESDDDRVDSEGDYAVAHFSVAMEQPIWDGKVYLSGAFSYEQLDAAHQMRYNAKMKRYEGDVLLKQGYYNYRYVLRDNRTGELRSAPLERDAYAAENDYLVFFYHRPFGERYDRLVGYQVINSKK